MKRVANRGEIWAVDLDPASGREQKGFRPVLVLSPKAFNQLGLVIIAPISQGGSFAREAGFVANLSGSGTKTQGAVLTNQITAIDMVARAGKFVEQAPTFVIDDAMARVHSILD